MLVLKEVYILETKFCLQILKYISIMNVVQIELQLKTVHKFGGQTIILITIHQTILSKSKDT